MELFESIRLQALLNVEKADNYEYLLRYIYRYVSKEYHISLIELEEQYLLEEILQIYWESVYEMMSSEDRYVEVQKLAKTHEEAAQEIAKQEIDDAAFVEKMKKAAKIKVPFKTSKKDPPPNLLRFIEEAGDPISPKLNKNPIIIKK